MIRRVLLFVLAFATGLGILALILGKEALLPVAESQERQDEPGPSLSPGAVRVSAGGAGEGSPVGGQIAFEGAGEISPLQDSVRIGNRVWQAPAFKLSWDDSQPVGSGRYRLINARFASYQKITASTVNPEIRKTVEVDARTMEVVLAQKKGELSIDSEHDVVLRGVTVRAPRESLGASFGSSIEMTVDRMVARVRGQQVQLDAPIEERVTIATKPAAGATMRYVLIGNGLTARLDDVVKVDDEIVSVGATAIRMMSNIEFRGSEIASSAQKFVLRADGALDMRAIDGGLLRAIVSDNVRFEGASNTASDAFRARGDRAVAWLRRGGLKSSPSDGKRASDLDSIQLTDLVITRDQESAGAEEGLASVDVGGQEIRAERFELAVDPWSRPERLVASGRPHVLLRDRDGEAIGKVTGTTRMFWERPGLAFDTTLRMLGVSPESVMVGTDAIASIFPSETLRVEGPTRYIPAPAPEKSSATKRNVLRVAECEGGALITLTRLLGRFEPVQVVGRGNARFTGTLRNGRAYDATGNRGFVIAHLPGSPFVRANLGPIDADGAHAFVFESGGDYVEGKGSVALRYVSADLAGVPAKERADGDAREAASARDFELQFHAAIREELRWMNHSGKEDAEITGIKTLRIASTPDGRRSFRATGLPLNFAMADIVASSASVERTLSNTMNMAATDSSTTGIGAWDFKAGYQPVNVRFAAQGGRPPAKLEAARMRVVVLPAVVPAPKAVPLLRVLASGSVLLTTEDPERSTKFRLECDELERFPQPSRALLMGAVSEALGDAGRLLAPLLWGGETGLLHARGRVTVRAIEVDAQQRVATREFEGASLWIDADRGLGRFILTGDANDEEARVTARLEQPGRGTVLLEGAKISGREGEFKLSAFANLERKDRHCFVRLVENGDPKTARRLRLRSSDSIRLIGDTLRVPGPVLAQMVDADDRYEVGNFELRAGGDAVVRLQTESKSESSDRLTTALPKSVRSCSADGGVEMRWAQVVAVGERLRYSPADAWLVLEDASKGVHVTVADTTRVRANPELAFNLRTHDYRGIRLRVEGLVGSR